MGEKKKEWILDDALQRTKKKSWATIKTTNLAPDSNLATKIVGVPGRTGQGKKKERASKKNWKGGGLHCPIFLALQKPGGGWAKNGTGKLGRGWRCRDDARAAVTTQATEYTVPIRSPFQICRGDQKKETVMDWTIQ